MAGSLLASARVVRGLLTISAGTLSDSFRSRLTDQTTDERIAWWAAGVVRDEGIRLQVEGRSNLLPGESFVVMSNHQSHLDIPVLFHAITPRMRMVTKKELFAFPIFGPALRRSGFVEVDRGNRGKAIESLHRAVSTVESGIHIWIAPEGTRSRSGELAPFKKGGFMLALEAGVRILPVGLWGTRDVLLPDTMLSHTGRQVAVTIGEPIDTSGRGRDELMGETRTAIEGLVGRAKALAGEG